MTKNTTTPTEEKRFSNEIGGDDYDLFLQIVPQYQGQQELVGKLTVEHWLRNGATTPIIELGCGSGLTTQAIYNIAPNARVVAIDSEDKMIAKMLSKPDIQQHKNLGNLKVIGTDATKYLRELTETEPETLDVIATSFMAHNFKHEDRNKLHALIYKALKPGGLFINMDKIAQDNTVEHYQAITTYLDRLVAGFRHYGRNETANGWITHYQVDNMPDRVQIESVVKADLKSAGFKHVEITDRIETDALITAIK